MWKTSEKWVGCAGSCCADTTWPDFWIHRRNQTFDRRGEENTIRKVNILDTQNILISGDLFCFTWHAKLTILEEVSLRDKLNLHNNIF